MVLSYIRCHPPFTQEKSTPLLICIMIEYIRRIYYSRCSFVKKYIPRLNPHIHCSGIYLSWYSIVQNVFPCYTGIYSSRCSFVESDTTQSLTNLHFRRQQILPCLGMFSNIYPIQVMSSCLLQLPTQRVMISKALT